MWKQRLKGYQPYQEAGYRLYLYEDFAPTVSVVAETPYGFPYPGQPVFVRSPREVMERSLEFSWREKSALGWVSTTHAQRAFLTRSGLCFAFGGDSSRQTSLADLSIRATKKGDHLRWRAFEAKFVLFVGFQLVGLAWNVRNQSLTLRAHANLQLRCSSGKLAEGSDKK